MTKLTYEQQISGAWFTSAQLKRAGLAGCEDRITSGRADGGYGMNVIDKAAGADRTERERIARRLLKVIEGEQ